jgi:fucose permease
VGVLAGLLLVWLPPVGAVREPLLQTLSTGAGIAGLWLAGFGLGPIFPTTIAVMSRLVPGRVLPSSIGFMTSAGSAGAALFPWLAGNVAERAGLWALMPYVMVLLVLLQGCWSLLQAAPDVAEPGG